MAEIMNRRKLYWTALALGMAAAAPASADPSADFAAFGFSDSALGNAFDAFEKPAALPNAAAFGVIDAVDWSTDVADSGFEPIDVDYSAPAAVDPTAPGYVFGDEANSYFQSFDRY